MGEYDAKKLRMRIASFTSVDSVLVKEFCVVIVKIKGENF
jgi:hypothetical protein